jgi:hypothetical protein
MRSWTKFSTGLLATGLLAGSLLGMSGCGPNYTLFKVDISSADTPRNSIEECRLTITDENGVVVVDKYVLPAVYGPPDSAGNPTLNQGCVAPLTKGNIGTLSYSSSRTTGTLTFRVDAWDNTGIQNNYTGKPVQSGSSSAAPAAYPPEVPVGVVMKIVP